MTWMIWITLLGPLVVCSLKGHAAVEDLLGEDGDHIIAIWRNNSLPCMFLAENLVLDKEMSLLFKVDVTVCTGVALRVAELVPQLDHGSPEVET